MVLSSSVVLCSSVLQPCGDSNPEGLRFSWLIYSSLSCLRKGLIEHLKITPFCLYLRWRTEQRSTARCGGRGPVRPKNTWQALLFFLLLNCSPPSTSYCPLPVFNRVYTAAHTLTLPFSSICLTFPPYARHFPFPPRAQLGLRFHSPGVLTFVWTPFASLHPLRFMSSFTVFILLCFCIFSCQIRLPVLVTHIHKFI